jgi:hypothetical protein
MNIDERLDRIAASLDILAKMHIDAERAAEERAAAADERAAAADERFAANEERIAEEEQRAAEAEARHEREMAAIRAELQRGIRLSIQEARAERRKRRELDDKITQLAAAQLVTEEKLQRFLEHRSGNGKP